MSSYIRPPDDVYWHFRRLSRDRQTGMEYVSREDGCLYRLRADRVICRLVDGVEVETIDSIPLRFPAGARVMTGVNWGIRMHISTYYQQIIGPSGEKARNKLP
ncbi:MAG: hypothetical protein JXB15_07015 [Anaerolineales bacterium]|nr:hypothetical protein [Anaerolineales bacterium]